MHNDLRWRTGAGLGGIRLHCMCWNAAVRRQLTSILRQFPREFEWKGRFGPMLLPLGPVLCKGLIGWQDGGEGWRSAGIRDAPVAPLGYVKDYAQKRHKDAAPYRFYRSNIGVHT